MTAKEKETIYNLLKAAAINSYSYVPENFKTCPVFEDDLCSDTIKNEIPIAETVKPVSATLISTKDIKIVENKDIPPVSLETINEKILRCTQCSLAQYRRNVVPGMGVMHPKVLIIGEAPGYEEDAQGLPFVGKSGLLLDKMLSAINLDRNTNCYIANIVKCRPPQNKDPLIEQQEACFAYLQAQIHILKPKMILCLGRISGQKMLNCQTPMTELHGQLFEYESIPLMVTYHPSALLRNPDLKRPAWEDLKKFRAKLNELS